MFHAFDDRAFSDTRAWNGRGISSVRDARTVDALVDVVADRAGFVDNEPSFTNGSPVTKPGRLRPCLILLDVLLLDRLATWSSRIRGTFVSCELRSLFRRFRHAFPSGLASF